MNTCFKVFASYNILQYLCDFIHVLIFVTVLKCQKCPKWTNIVITSIAATFVVYVSTSNSRCHKVNPKLHWTVHKCRDFWVTYLGLTPTPKIPKTKFLGLLLQQIGRNLFSEENGVVHSCTNIPSNENLCHSIISTLHQHFFSLIYSYVEANFSMHTNTKNVCPKGLNHCKVKDLIISILFWGQLMEYC